jgi:hypothetical protein
MTATRLAGSPRLCLTIGAVLILGALCGPASASDTRNVGKSGTASQWSGLFLASEGTVATQNAADICVATLGCTAEGAVRKPNGTYSDFYNNLQPYQGRRLFHYFGHADYDANGKMIGLRLRNGDLVNRLACAGLRVKLCLVWACCSAEGDEPVACCSNLGAEAWVGTTFPVSTFFHDAHAVSTFWMEQSNRQATLVRVRKAVEGRYAHWTDRIHIIGPNPAFVLDTTP